MVGDSRPLLLAKVSIPTTAPATVARLRLQERMREAGSTRLTAVVAPSGWGKSTMLAAWAQGPEWGGRTGWLSLDEADNEPIRFWTYALSALDRVAPALTRDSLAVLQAPGMDPVGLALSLLLNALTGAEETHALVLDDYHLMTDSPHPPECRVPAQLPPADPSPGSGQPHGPAAAVGPDARPR